MAEKTMDPPLETPAPVPAKSTTPTTSTTTTTTTTSNNNTFFDDDNPPELELLRRELEKERQSKMALENMIIVSSLNMIGKIEVLEKKHESQVEQLRDQLQQYADKEQEHNILTRSLEETNLKLRSQLADLQKKFGKDGKDAKDVDGKEGKRKRQMAVSEDAKDLSPRQWETTPTGKMKRSKSDSTHEKKGKGNKNANNNNNNNSFSSESDPLREMVAEALGTFGDIEKRPPRNSLQSSSEGNLHHRRSKSNISTSQSEWPDAPSSPTIPDTPPIQGKRRKQDIASSQDGSTTPPLMHSSPGISDSYTSNYSTFFQYGTAASGAYPASPSSAPSSPPSASLASSTSSTQYLSSSQNGAHLTSQPSYLSSSQNGNRSPEEADSPSSKQSVQLVPLFPPSSVAVPNSPHEKLLADVHQLQIAQKDRLEKMQQSQKQLILERKHDPLLVGALESEQMQLRQQMDAEIKAIKQLDKQVILEPNQLFRLDFLLQDLKIQQKQLELFHNELQLFLSAPDPSRCHAALVITKQPFPMVISKFKQLQEEQLVVQLLSGSNVDFHSFSVVKAELICHTKAITKGSTSASNPNASLKKHVDRDTQPLDLSKGVAKFPLKFLTGTRKSCVTLRFVVQVKTASNTVSTVESNASQPFIVITNDCQWEGSEGTLLKNEAFSDQIEIPWPQFVNILQRHFLKATRQSPIQPTRPLSLYDFNYLNTKFFANKLIVSHKSFDNFWAWFGKSLQTVRYKRHISTLWQNGLIFMFLSRERVTQILRNQDPGCFIILFSEAYPGQLEISYVASDKLGSSQQNLLGSSLSGMNSLVNLRSSSHNVPTSISNPTFDNVSHHNANPLTASYDGIKTADDKPTVAIPTPESADSSAPSTPAIPSAPSTPLSAPSMPTTPISSIPIPQSPNTPALMLAPPATPSTPTTAISTTPATAGLHITSAGNKIKHYLVQANDTAGSKRTLPDFLNECPQFTHILQLNVSSLNTSTDWTTIGAPSFKKQPKDQVLEPFYSKRGTTSPGFIANGYDPL